MNTEKRLKIFIGILVLIIVVTFVFIFIVPKYNEYVIEDYKEYMWDNLLVIYEINESGIEEVPLINIISLWAATPENQMLVVNDWISRSENLELVREKVCGLPS